MNKEVSALFDAAVALCQEPIRDDAEEELDKLRAQVPKEYQADFEWFNEALFVARQ